MPLTLDITDQRKLALKEALSVFLHHAEPHIDACIVTGSLGYNWDHHVFTTSDLDLFVVGDEQNACKALAGLYDATTKSKMLDLYSTGRLQLFSFKGEYEGIPLSIYYTSLHTLTRILTFEQNSLTAFRQFPKISKTTLHGFFGRISYEFQNTPVQGGFLHEVPTCIHLGGCYYVGPLHGRFLHHPRIVFDATGQIKRMIDNFETELFDRMILEGANDPVSVLRNAKYFSEEMKRNIRARANEYIGRRHLTDFPANLKPEDR